MHRWNWNDLRIILAVTDNGSLAGAARALGINHTTVLRRITAFEKQHAVRLFDRLSSGYATTQAGLELLGAARAMHEVVSELERKLVGQDLRLEGTVRVTTCDTLMASLLPPVLAEFREQHPRIALEATTGSFVSNLSERQADVAVRTGEEPPDALIGQRVGSIRFGVYGAVTRNWDAVDLLRHDRWLCADMPLGGMEIYRWVRASVPQESIVFRADSLVTLRQAALSGIGLVPLPRYLGDATQGLQRIPCEAVDHFQTGLWVLTHQDLRHTSRVRAFVSFAVGQLRAELLRRGDC